MRTTHTLAHFARTLVVMAVVVVPLIGSPWHTAAAGSGTWKEQVLPAPPPESLPVLEIRCPSITVCYALRGTNPGPGAPHPKLQKSIDGGVTWTEQQLNVSLALGSFSPQRLACPSIGRCYLLINTNTTSPPASAILMTADGGRTWTQDPVGMNDELERISCPSSTICYVSAFVTGPSLDLLSTHDGGQTWTSTRLTVTDGPLFSLSCPGVDDCYLSGFLLGGTQPNGPTKGVKGLAATHDGGQTWMVHTGAARTSPGYFTLACPTSMQCYAFGDAGLAMTDDGGQTWSRLPARGLPLNVQSVESTIVCSNVLICYVLLGQLWRTTDGGLTWTAESSESSLVIGLACPAASTCYGASIHGVLVKTPDGETWQELTPLPLGLDAIACPDPDTCYAVGHHGAVLTTTNGGATWVHRSAGTNADLSSVTCPALKVCLAVGSLPSAAVTSTRAVTPVLLRTADGGHTWHTVNPAANSSWGPALTCPSSTICFDAGIVRRGTSSLPIALKSSDAGNTWGALGSLPTGYWLQGLACSTTTRCIGVGGVSPCVDDLARLDVSAGTPSPQSWQADCQADGWLFDTTDGGRHWLRELRRTDASHATPDLITSACPRTTQCYAGGYGVWLRTTHGRQRWTVTSTQFPEYAQPPLGNTVPTDFIQSLSCTGLSTCWGIAVHLSSFGGIPVLTTDGGRHWHAVDANVPLPNPYTPFQSGLLALTCPRPSTCFALGGDRIMAYWP